MKFNIWANVPRIERMANRQTAHGPCRAQPRFKSTAEDEEEGRRDEGRPRLHFNPLRFSASSAVDHVQSTISGKSGAAKSRSRSRGAAAACRTATSICGAARHRWRILTRRSPVTMASIATCSPRTAVAVTLATRLAEIDSRAIGEHYAIGSSAVGVIPRRLAERPDALRVVESLARQLRKRS